MPKFLSKLIYHFLLRKGGLAIVNVHGEYSKDPGQDRFQLNLVVGIKKIYEKMETSAHNLIQEYRKCSNKHHPPQISAPPFYLNFIYKRSGGGYLSTKSGLKRALI